MAHNFKKTAYNPYDNLQSAYMASQQRVERYVDFDQMEYTPEIASALDIYADEMTTHSSLQNIVKMGIFLQKVNIFTDKHVQND